MYVSGALLQGVVLCFVVLSVAVLCCVALFVCVSTFFPFFVRAHAPALGDGRQDGSQSGLENLTGDGAGFH